MLNILDRFLDKITMYKLVHYELIILLVIAGAFGLFGLMPYSPWSILFSSIFLVAVSVITNKIFAIAFDHAPVASDSSYITALILALILKPPSSIHDIPLLFWAAVLSQAAKYILAINKKHIFNPVAIAVVLTAFWLGESANWWVGTTLMAPFVVLLGITIVRKIQREDMIFTFFLVGVVASCGLALIGGKDIFVTLQALFLHSSLLFFGFVMFTEPLTTPPTKNLQVIYGVIVGVLFSPMVHIGSIFSTPELALVVGNIYSFFVSPKQKLLLKLKEKIQIGADNIDFAFVGSRKLAFSPGQYMEWTLPHKKEDFRGNRRYFTLASSPTEETIKLGVKFYPNGSTFKKALAAFSANDTIVAGQLAGDFTLPEDPQKKLIFIAGGIGITPYRSMIKYLIDIKQQRDIILLYANKLASEIMYADVFSQAETDLGIRTIYTLTDETQVPQDWQGRVGRITPEIIQSEIPDYKERMFYLSGPHVMVEYYEQVLKQLGISHAHIKKDFFPGFV